MPTLDPQQAIDFEHALDLVRRRAFGSESVASDPGLQVGLEPERFAWRLDPTGRPSRLPLNGPGGIVEALDALAQAEPRALTRDQTKPLAQFNLSQGGSLTFEPGGQIEHSTRVHQNLSEALDDAEAVDRLVDRAFKGMPVQQGFLGLDPFHTVAQIPQQLSAPRYRAMARYLDQRGPSGAAMMRLSASVQVNLDLGPPAEREERAWLGFLLSPALTAIFSSSPNLPGQTRRHSRRARVWQTIDPTRSGFPRGLLDRPQGSVVESYVEAALNADLLLWRDGQGGAEPGVPGQSFAAWLKSPHPRLGWPTAEDLEYHLSTLFFEVRCRGFFELRPLDALPASGRAAAAAFVCGLLLDPIARGHALERLAAWRPQLSTLWWRSADLGLAAPELRSAALDLFELAGQGLGRLGEGFLRAPHRRQFERFFERFTARGLAPADLVREALEQDPKAALAWASSGQGCPGDPAELKSALE